MNKNYKGKFIIFCLVGGIATLIDFVIFNLAAHILGNGFLMPQLSRTLGIIVSMSWNFTMNRHVTFKAGEDKITKQLPKWLTVYGFTALLNLGVFTLILNQMGNSLYGRNIAFICGTGVSMILNFIGSLHWTFNKKN